MGSEYSGGGPNQRRLGKTLAPVTIRITGETSAHQHFTSAFLLNYDIVSLLVRPWQELIALRDNCSGEELEPSSSLGKKRPLSLHCHTLLLTHY